MKVFIHNPFFRIFSPPIYGVLIYLLILLIHNNVNDISLLFVNQEVYVMIALSLISFEIMRLTIFLLDKTSIPIANRIPLQIFSTTALSVVVVLLDISQYYKWVIWFDISSREVLTFGVIFSLTSLLYNALYLGNEYLHRENTQRFEHEHKLRESLESEFSSFRQEINPDLLYDSLEELILCLHKKAETAEELIDSLASLYRYQLINRQKEFTSLSEELSAIGKLLRLANQKHGGNILWKNDIQETENIQIMPGALITAMDSIIRNTLISKNSPLVLTLSAEDEDYFVLQHDLNDKLQIHSESLLAFQRLQRSYSMYSDRPFVQVKAGRENYIKFPLLKVDQTLLETA